MDKMINSGREWDWLDSLKGEREEVEETREQFTRLAEAMLMSRYKFKPQRRAIAAKMYTKWLERKMK